MGTWRAILIKDKNRGVFCSKSGKLDGFGSFPLMYYRREKFLEIRPDEKELIKVSSSFLKHTRKKNMAS